MIKYIYPSIFKHTLFKLFAIVCILGTLVACERDNNEESITETSRYSSDDLESYEDLFITFWTIMDSDYNYFNEEKDRNGLDWDEVYTEYLPKFQALKTWWKSEEFDTAPNDQITEDAEMAIEYFEEILAKSIDKHFALSILFPKTRTIGQWSTFRTGPVDDDSPLYYPKASTMKVTSNKLEDGYFYSTSSPSLLSGKFTSNPDIHYLSFSSFSVKQKYEITLNSDDLLFEDAANTWVGLSRSELENNDKLNAIPDVNLRNITRNWTLKVYDAWYNALSKDLKTETFYNAVNTFNTTEEVTDVLVDETAKLKGDISELPGSYINQYLTGNLTSDEESIISSDEAYSYIVDFQDKLYYMKYGYNFFRFEETLNNIEKKYEIYQKLFNPLTRGEIKKLIVDLRGNGGGAVVDARFLTERFVTKEALVAYQRTKEGNGRFNYTPWIPAYTKPHPFAIPENIPIVVLTDKGSVSMSEISTLTIKSQGDQVTVVGDYTLGGTAGLGNPDDFNGGYPYYNDVRIAYYFKFYMPLMAFKDASGKVIEAIGVEPDVYVAPPTQEEIDDMSTNPDHKDRALEKAIEVLTSM